jgi:SAM-dependent methyltransferase
MCNIDTFQWVAKNLLLDNVQGKKVLEVGSCDVNGSIRSVVEILKPEEYIGIDIASGPGVDIICRAEDLVKQFGENSFDFIISTCVLEHVRHWKTAIKNMKKVCKKDGLIIIVVPYKWAFHGHPSDYWRYSKEDVENIFSDFKILQINEDKGMKKLVYVKAQKPNDYKEYDISDYKLYSVVTGNKVTGLTEHDFKQLRFKLLVFKSKLVVFLLDIGRKIFSRPN